MSPVVTIARRELGSMFRAPLAYVFLVLFLVVSQLPHALTVFASGQAELRLFFDFLPWCIAVFAALVTMRSWAEERQENTYEMLLTFPMRDRHLVLGKWLAAFAFLAVGILLTGTLAIMVFSVGSPDPGPIVAGYAGALLLAATAAAAGVFFSGLSRSQLLAALLSLVGGFLTLLVGTEVVATLVDAQLGGVGRFLRSCIGAWSHYAVFTRGVIELLDVFFFAAWTLLFLHLNTLFLALRRVADSWPRMVAATALGLGCGMLASRLTSEGSLERADLTEDRLYTLSPGTLAILAQAQVPVQVKYYVSPRDEMPSQYKALEREVVDRLTEISVASRGKLRFSVLHMNLENLVVTPEEEAATLGEDDESSPFALDPEEKEDEGADDAKKTEAAKKSAEAKAKSIERRLLEKGVRPFTVESYEATETSAKLIYSTLGIAYREKDEEFITPVVPQRLSELEYLLSNTVAKITRDRPPRIALVTGEEPMDPQLRMMYERMGQKIPDPFSRVDDLLRQEKYDVVPVELTAQSPMPEDYDALVVLGPVQLNERQRWEIGRALAEGRPTLLALQRYTWEYVPQGRQIQIRHESNDSGIDDLLEANGLGVATEFLMDVNSRPISVPSGGLFPLTVPSPTHVFVTSNQMNKDSPLTQRLSSIFYLWGTAVDLDAAKLSGADMKRTILLTSSEKSWQVPADRPLRQNDLVPDGKELKPQPLVVLVEGQFKDPASEKPRPKWPPKIEMDPMGRPMPAPPDGDETPLVPARGKLVLAGCARMWSDMAITSGQLGNADFLLNCVDALTLDENLLLVRSKQPTDRAFEKPAKATAVMWTLLPLVFVPLTVVGTGVFIAVLRFRRRESWNQAHGRWRA